MNKPERHVPSLFVLAFLVFPLNLGQAAEQASKNPTLLNAPEAHLREILEQRVVKNPLLHGAWADVRRSQNGQYEIAVIVDSDVARGDAQCAELERIVNEYLPKQSYRLEPPLRLPFCRVLSQLKDVIDEEAELAGSRIDDGYYQEAGPELFLVLVGRVVSDTQKVLLINKANDILRETYGPKTARISKVKSEGTAKNDPGLAIVQPSEVISADFYGRGIDYFRQDGYPEAYQAFSTAYLELPHGASSRRRAVVIQYWRAACLIGMHDRIRAGKLLKPIIDARHDPRFQGQEENVPFALETVQGPIRHELEGIENQIVYGCQVKSSHDKQD